jgi:predicted RNA-binding Zn ribbon-like protein
VDVTGKVYLYRCNIQIQTKFRNSMATSTSDMRLSGGHPALDFANTVDCRLGRWGPDFLHSFDDLLVLAERTAVLDSVAVSNLRKKASTDPERARTVIDQALTLREAIHQVFLAEDTERAYPSAALKVVETAAREGRSRERLTRSRLGFVWSVPFDELEDVGRAFALTAIELLIARNGRREVRECKGDNCGWLFLDHSKGGHRMWCSDASCGTRSRIARFRARLKPKIEEF